MMKTEQPRQFDLIVVGAGVVGSTLACALGGTEMRVALVEAQPCNSQWPVQENVVSGFDARVSALTVASQQLLQQLEVWPSIHSHRASPYQGMHVWDAEGTGSIDFSAEDINQPVLGHIVENRVISCALLQRIEQHPNIELISPVSLKQIEPLAQGGYCLQLADGCKLQAPLVVAADGANSNIRRLADFTMREWDYNHRAIVATVETEKPHQQTAWQRFLPEGPLAFLPLTTEQQEQNFCSIVWSAVPQYADSLMSMNDLEFCQQLAISFEHKLGAITGISKRFSFSLRQRHALDYIKPGLALIGDAAHTIHPLAGQGVNLGLMDVKVLSEELLRAKYRHLDIGSLAVLQRYQRRRKAANLSMMASMEGFKRLFAETALPVRWLRNTGMYLLNKATPIKHRLMRQAMGL